MTSKEWTAKKNERWWSPTTSLGRCRDPACHRYSTPHRNHGCYITVQPFCRRCSTNISRTEPTVVNLPIQLRCKAGLWKTVQLCRPASKSYHHVLFLEGEPAGNELGAAPPELSSNVAEPARHALPCIAMQWLTQSSPWLAISDICPGRRDDAAPAQS